MKAVGFYLGLCAILLGLSLFFRQMGDAKQSGVIVTAVLMVCFLGLVTAICRNKG